MTTEAQKRASAKYNKENAVIVTLKLNKKYDADIIQKLDKVPSKQGYIKDCIRTAIANGVISDFKFI